MNIIAGMMMPEMNCAPKLASYSSSFLAAKRGLDLAAAGRTPSPARAR